MTFVSFNFYIFLAIVILVYYILPLRVRWIALLVGSLFFYAYISEYSIAKVSSLVVAAFLCWIFGIFQCRFPKLKKVWLTLSIAAVGLPLIIIKEIPFLTYLTGWKKPDWLIVPIGIAFYSMQLISYSVDVYYGKTNGQRNYFKFLLFASFFPQIIQGPIPRYNQLQSQLIEGHRFDERRFVKGFMLILWGFFLKLCIADKAAVIVNAVFDNYPTYKGMYVLVAGVLYSFELYTDFLACTTFAQGMSGMLGIEIMDNFNHPYFADSVKEFWRRWHISLSSWLRDYIYIPLGGNRKVKFRKYLNLMITFAVSGIWHGAGYKFLFWGLLHSAYQISGEILIPIKNRIERFVFLNEHSKVNRIIKIIITFNLVTVAWIIFRAESLKTAFSMIKSIFTVRNVWILTDDSIFELGLGWKECIVLLFCLFILLAVSYFQEKGVQIRERVLELMLPLRWFVYIGTIIFILIFGTYGYGFDAQSFIYGGF